jgi:hypothetical protein
MPIVYSYSKNINVIIYIINNEVDIYIYCDCFIVKYE